MKNRIRICCTLFLIPVLLDSLCLNSAGRYTQEAFLINPPILQIQTGVSELMLSADINDTPATPSTAAVIEETPTAGTINTVMSDTVDADPETMAAEVSSACVPESKAPDLESEASDAESQAPDAEAEVPEAESKTPDTESETPGTENETSGTETENPEETN